MRAVLLVVLLATAAFVGLPAPPLDFVVLLDVSESMFPYFGDSVDFLIRSVLAEGLAPGDTLHLLSFATTPEWEVSATVATGREIQGVFTRVLLLQPLGQHTDLVSALEYLTTYVRETPAESEKKILVLTDGIHDPPTGGAGESVADPVVILESDSAFANGLRREGWDVAVIRFPRDQRPSAIERVTPESAQLSDSSAGEPDDATPDARDDVVTRDARDAVVTTGNQAIRGEEADSVDAADTVTAEERGDATPTSADPVREGNDAATATREVTEGDDPAREIGSETDGLELVQGATEGSITSANGSDTDETVADELPERGARVDPDRVLQVIMYAGLAAIGLAAVLGLILLVRRLASNLGGAATKSPAVRYKEIQPGERAIEMFVEGQNRSVGSRNVHVIRENGSKSVGGGRSAFLIFAYPISPRIAEIVRKGDQYTYVPLKSEASDTRAINDCLDQIIPVVSDQGRRIQISFHRYVSPLERINAIMHYTDAPGRVSRG